jgi:hypothetical protein
MLYQGHVEHLQPCAKPRDRQAVLQPVDSLLLVEASSFAMTASGEGFADCFLAYVFSNEEDDFEAAWQALKLGRLVPRYDQDNRVLTWGQNVLKCYRQPSANQELLLRTAEELDWPEWFDDPLPKARVPSPKVRLHDTIKALNQNQKTHILHFKGDGTGTRVGWEFR